MAGTLLLALAILAATAAAYSALARKAAARFGPRTLLLAWPLATLILLGYQLVSWRVESPEHGASFLPWYAYAIGAFAVFLGFGLATRTIWLRFGAPGGSPPLSAAAIVKATSAFFLGLLLGLLPLLVLDVIALAQPS